MRKFFLLAIVIPLIFTFSPVTDVLAQTGWSHEFDFLVDDGGWEDAGYGTVVYVPETGWGNLTDGIVGIHIPVYGNISAVSFDISGPMSGNYKAVFISLTDYLEDPTTVYTDIGTTETHFEWSGTAQLTQTMTVIIQSNTPAPGAPDSVYITNIVVEGPGNTDPFLRYKPMSDPDIFSILDENRTVWANKENPNVHSVTPGEIVHIQHNLLASTWAVTIAPPGAGADGDRLLYENLQSINGELGDFVSAGCVLGLAVTSSTEGSYPAGKLTMTLPEEIQDDWPGYADSPNNLPCDVDTLLTPNCVDLNPNLANNAESWNFDGHVEAGPQGVTVFSNAALYQDVTLDDVNAYTVTLLATTTLGTTSATIDITFGEASASLHLSAPGAMQFVELKTQPLSIGAADYAPDLYRLRIQNTAPPGHLATPVLIKFICIGTTDVAYAPGDCYFADPNLKTDEWDADAGVTYSPPVGNQLTGVYTVPATKAIFRGVDISAFADADTDFSLTTGTYNWTGAPLVGPYGRWHAYIRDSTTLDLLQDIGTWDTLPVILTQNRTDFTLTEGEHIVGDLVIENISDEITSPGWDLRVQYVCLSVEGGVWPGYDNTDTGSLFTADCTLCSQPGSLEDVTTDTLLSWVVMWLQFGWCYLGYILRCLVLSALNSIWGTVLSVIAGIGLFGIWVGRVIGVAAIWAADGGRFFLRNLLAGIIPIANSILAWLFAQPFFIDALDGISLALIWFEAIIQIIVGIFGLFSLAIQFVGAMLNLIGVAWTAIIEGLQGTSAITFPFPDCTDPETPFYDACFPLDIANFVFTQVPALGVLINSVAFAIAWKTMRKAWRRGQEALNS